MARNEAQRALEIHKANKVLAKDNLRLRDELNRTK